MLKVKNKSLLVSCFLLAGAAIFSSINALANPATAQKSKWLECAGYTINLDEDKEKYSAKLASYLYQGRAIFFPQQITFEILFAEYANGGGEKKSFTINRKDLSYKMVHTRRIAIADGTYDTGWVQQIGSPINGEGTCKVIKSPTVDNKI